MIVLDTNVVSELMRTAPAPAVVDWVSTQRPEDLVTTAVTLAEIRYGIVRLPPGRRAELLAAAADEVFAAFADRILAFDGAAADAYADIVVRRERAGLPISGFDAQIAAVCRSRGAALATRNTDDFEHVDLDLTDPWAPGS